MTFLLTQWKWLLPTVAASFFAVMWGYTEIQLSDLKTSVATATTKATEAARVRDAENARLAAAADRSHMEKLDALEKADTAARDLARARGLYVKARSQCVSGTTSDTGSNPDGTTEVRLHDEDSDALLAIARDADRAAAYAQTCHQWAKSVGRP